MGISILFGPISKTLPINNDRGDRDDDDEIQHMRAIKIQLQHLLFQILQKVIFGLTRVAQLLNRVVHRVVVVERQPRRAHSGCQSQCIYFAVFVQDAYQEKARINVADLDSATLSEVGCV